MTKRLKTIRRGSPREASRSRSEGESRRPVSEAYSPEDFLSAKWRAIGALLCGAFLWAYWPTLVELVHAWETQPDYSHGYFVVPLAIFFLWARRDKFPAEHLTPALSGLILVAIGAAVRIVGGWYFVGALDGWSIPFWVGGVCLLLGGWQFFKWALPSVLFLFFMIPLPFAAETALSYELQGIATKLSCAGLQVLGQPALQEGHVILLGEHPPLEVAQACSGLRIFMGIVALAFAYVIVVRRPWWEKGLLILSVLPIALVANATRIVATGLLYQYASGDAAHKFSHDVAGYVMIPFAAALLAMVLWYLGQLFKEIQIASVGDVIRRSRV